MAKLLDLTNDTAGNRERIRFYTFSQSGNHVAATAVPMIILPEAGEIVSVNLSAVTFTTSTDRTLAATVKKVITAGTATAVCSTDPSFAATASGTGMKSTVNGGTGITVAVVKSDGTQVFAIGDAITVDVTIAGANGTVGTGASVTVGYKPYTI